MKLIIPFIQLLVIASVMSVLCIGFRYYDERFIYAEPWLINLYKAKDYINEMPTNKQRLIILSGSNSLFGFNGEIIDKNTKFRPINYGTHASIPINYQIDRIMQHAKDGDIIFMPLEFSYYIRNAPTDSLWYISNMLYWGNGYRKYISIFEIINIYIKSSKPTKSIEYFLKNIFKNKERLKPKVAEFDVNKMQEKDVVYDYKGLNFYGDFCTQQDILKESDINSGFKYVDDDFKVTDFFISEFKRLESWAKEHKIKVFLTYTVTLESKYFSLKDSKTFEKVENLKKQLAQNGIKIYGDFRDFHFEREYFFDTASHLNANGATLRTQNFIKLLKEMERNKEI